jgi:hypothetical protein
MIACPVCEHQQESNIECEVCGKALLPALVPPPVAIERVEGLEATLQADVADVPLQVLPELEATRQPSPAQVPVERMAEIELSRFEATQAPVGERMPEMSDDRAPDDGVRTVLTEGPATCRYCRNVQAEGAMCDRCGMKLQRVAPSDVIAGTEIPAERVRCKACGASSLAGQRCGDCGQLVPFP